MPENPSPFEPAQDKFRDESMGYLAEGRKSYIRIKNKKNWPPTMEDLLEYITIYSQMNNIKFASLNRDKYFELKGKKKTNRRKKITAKQSSHVGKVTDEAHLSPKSDVPKRELVGRMRTMSLVRIC